MLGEVEVNSLIVPVSKNEANLERLLAELMKMASPAATGLPKLIARDRNKEVDRRRLNAIDVISVL
jgi:hypothetical protein